MWRKLAYALLAGNDPQTFLDRGVPWLLRRYPKQSLALRLMALSPHYFIDGNPPRSQHERLMRSREQLAQIVRRYTTPGNTVLDFGCGPGYLTHNLTEFSEAIGADISRGALACAEILNPGPRYIRFTNSLPDESVDVICSFAVAQHLSDERLRNVLGEWVRVLKSGGTVICHVVVNQPGWREEKTWRTDRSLRGRLRFRYGLNCFSRNPDAMKRLITEAGFSDPEMRRVYDLGKVDDDVGSQHLFVFAKH